ncbi:uncharacterized protein [Lolium perenne]|uniref:uncharacterized protein n=1 Tax=Lolium perenne TaxID=4522 RepID=UPI003A99A15A
MAADLDGKVSLATDYYLGLLGTPQPREHNISLEAVGLLPVDFSALEGRFTEEEVREAIRAMPPNKSPGPDGFTSDFYRHCWPIIKVDVIAAMHALWLGRDQFFGDLNGALITLLPKKDGAVDLQDFRPISLVHSFARLFTKVLARRLAPRMADLVDENQTAFIHGRCIQDNFLLVKESARLLHRKRIPSLLLKIDIAKVLTVYLGLSSLVCFGSEALALGGSTGFSSCCERRAPGPCRVELAAIWALLDCFGGASGLRANNAKSTTAPIRCPPATLDEIEVALPCPMAQLPCRYLGLPLSIGKPRKAELHAAIDKLADQLPFWKARLLSREGRLVYVQAVLGASVVYQLLALGGGFCGLELMTPRVDAARLPGG